VVSQFESIHESVGRHSVGKGSQSAVIDYGSFENWKIALRAGGPARVAGATGTGEAVAETAPTALTARVMLASAEKHSASPQLHDATSGLLRCLRHDAVALNAAAHVPIIGLLLVLVKGSWKHAAQKRCERKHELLDRHMPVLQPPHDIPVTVPPPSPPSEQQAL
jgi:hypothetical protein